MRDQERDVNDCTSVQRVHVVKVRDIAQRLRVDLSIRGIFDLASKIFPACISYAKLNCSETNRQLYIMAHSPVNDSVSVIPLIKDDHNQIPRLLLGSVRCSLGEYRVGNLVKIRLFRISCQTE